MEVLDWIVSPNKLENPFKCRNKGFVNDVYESKSEGLHKASLLLLACSNEDLTLLSELLHDINIDINCAELYDGSTPLHQLSLLTGCSNATLGIQSLIISLHITS